MNKNTSTSALAPGFLIASPPLGDPNFDRTVVLLAAHGDSGALGFVVNRPAPVTFAELLSFAGYAGESTRATRAIGETPVYLGGPVQPSSGWILCIDPGLEPDDGVIAAGDRIRITSSRSAFDTLAADADAGGLSPDPRQRAVLLGYSGWGPGQLEREIATGSWLPVPLDERILFEVPIEQRWEQAYKVLGLSPVEVMSMRSVGEA